MLVLIVIKWNLVFYLDSSKIVLRLSSHMSKKLLACKFFVGFFYICNFPNSLMLLTTTSTCSAFANYTKRIKPKSKAMKLMHKTDFSGNSSKEMIDSIIDAVFP